MSQRFIVLNQAPRILALFSSPAFDHHSFIVYILKIFCLLTMQWTDCIIDKIFKNIELVKFITTVLKSILNLVKLQSLVAKCCKMQKIQACKVCKFCILLYYARNTDTTIEKTVSIFRT